MKSNPFRLIFFLSSVILLSSCLGTTTTTDASSDPGFVSLKFAANDSIPYLSSAVFTLDGKTITNVDSLPFNTRIDSVYPTFTFTSSAGIKYYIPATGYKYKNKKDFAFITGTDTIDFRQPIRLVNYAANAKDSIEYTVNVNVHQVDPELYNWASVSGNLNSSNSVSQKTILLNDKFCYYQNDGSATTLNTSLDGYNWSIGFVTGLPANVELTSMLQLNGKLFLLQNGSMYSSVDGQTWTNHVCTPVNYTYKTLLVTLNDSLRAVVQSADQSYRFAGSKDGLTWFINNKVAVPTNFPISDFASVSFNAPTGKSRALVLQGSTTIGANRNNWSTEDGYYWLNFANENHTLDTLSIGPSVISYDSKLFVFGTRNDTIASFYKVSTDEGLSWKKLDTLKNKLPAGYSPRTYQSVVVFKPLALKGVQPDGLKQQILQSNRIFIIGGKSGSTSYSDVWTGKLNRKNFLRQ